MLLFFALFQIAFARFALAAKDISPAYDPACVARFLKNIGPANPGGIRVSDLPDHILISADKARSFTALELSKNAWQKLNELDQLSESIHKLADGNLSVLKPKLIAQLKSSRKYGSVYRESFGLFDKNHEAPKNFEKFITRFGKLNDAIAANAKPDIIESAREVQMSLEGASDFEGIGEFNPVKHGEFKANTQKTMRTIHKLLDQKSLTSEEYHSLRKQVRKLSVYFLSDYAVTANEADQKIIDYLKGVSDQMGETHDQIVAAELTGKKPTHRKKLKLEPDLRERISEFLRRVDLESES